VRSNSFSPQRCRGVDRFIGLIRYVGLTFVKNIAPQRRRGNKIYAEIGLATFYFYFKEISLRPSFYCSPPF
jgi:hypothetical protein